MRIILSIVMLCFINVQLAFATNKYPSPFNPESREWTSYYYVFKDNSEVSAFLQWLENSKILDNNETAYQPTIAFLSVIFKDNPSKLQEWVKSVKFNGKAKEAILEALWLSGNTQIISKIFKKIPDYAKLTPTPLLNTPVKLPKDLDIMWAAFFASGNVSYVKKIIDVLDESIPLTDDKTMVITMRKAAEWSLGANIIEHTLVSRIVKKEINIRTGKVKNKLKEIAELDKKNIKLLPNHDGYFSAMLVLFDENAPKDNPLKNIAKIKRGDSIEIRLFFSGMESNDELLMHLTADLKILDPDGKVYSNIDYKAIELSNTKVQEQFVLMSTDIIKGVKFNSESKPGKYTILSIVYDKIGRKKIKLTEEIELIQ